MSNPIGWFEIYVQDIARAKVFYEAVLGTPLTKLEATELEMWAFPMSQEGYGASGALVKMQGVPSGGNSTLVYFSCADCAVEADKAAKAGGTIETTKNLWGSMVTSLWSTIRKVILSVCIPCNDPRLRDIISSEVREHSTCELPAKFEINKAAKCGLVYFKA